MGLKKQDSEEEMAERASVMGLDHGSCGLKKKKKHSLKTENFVLFGRLAEEVSLGGSLSASSEVLL